MALHVESVWYARASAKRYREDEDRVASKVAARRHESVASSRRQLVSDIVQGLAN